MQSEVHWPDAPIELGEVMPDRESVVALLERNAPYLPLGGWFRPDQDDDSPTSRMWFQKTLMGGEVCVEGSEMFVEHEGVLEAMRTFYDAEVIVPHTLFVNLMAGIPDGGPAHTDNPLFRGRDRLNTPMLLLRTMHWSGLFAEWETVQATSIWWMDDVEGGGILFWPDGPHHEPHRHFGAMSNTALVGDNHGMFHQVEPVGPFDQGDYWVTPRAEMGPSQPVASPSNPPDQKDPPAQLDGTCRDCLPPAQYSTWHQNVDGARGEAHPARTGSLRLPRRPSTRSR